MAIVDSVSATTLGSYYQDVQLALTNLQTSITNLTNALATTNSDVSALDTELNDALSNLGVLTASYPATLHTDGVNTDCNNLTYGRHVVFSDGANATTPAPAGLYLIENRFVSTDGGTPVVSQLGWRYSTGLLYTRLLRLGVWSAWNKVG